MAQKTQIVLISDLSGKELPDGRGETIEFSYRGVDYQIDLSDKEAAGFDKSVAIYLAHATKVGGRGGRRRASRGAPVKADREQLAAMRRWAQDNGYQVSGRGRVSNEIQQAYHARTT
jgi:hypothetical protein